MKGTFFQYLARQVGGLRDMEAIPLLTPEMNPKFNDFGIRQTPKEFGIGPFIIETGKKELRTMVIPNSEQLIQ